MEEEYPDERRAEEAAEKSEHLLDETYLSGAVGMGAAGPRLSASALDGHDDDGILAQDDDSWRSHSLEEGDPGDSPPSGRGLRGALRRLFGR